MGSEGSGVGAVRVDAGPPTTGPETICACATATGGHAALLRLSGGDTRAIAARAALPLPEPWRWRAGDWPLAGGRCPVRVLLAPAGRSFTGCDLVEILLPGAPDLVELALAALRTAGAAPAPPGGFARQALANGRLTLDRAEALLAVVHAPDANAARAAVARLRGALADELAPARARLIALRAEVEAQLDLADEGLAASDAAALRAELAALRGVLARWRVAAEGGGGLPVVALAGPANAGKSALFARLTGAPALVSPVAGTTRDALEADWDLGGRRVRLVDTAGWLADAPGIEAEAVARARAIAQTAALVLACSAPDAPLPLDAALPAGALVLATKADLGPCDARAALAVSARSGAGLAELTALVAGRLAGTGLAEPRQQRLLAEGEALAATLALRLPPDELLAEDLRRLADLLGDLIGATTADDVLDAIFARFCVGK